MKASNVVNNNQTRVFISEVGRIWLEHAGKERGQKCGTNGRSLGSMVSFIAADGSVLILVWIFCETLVGDKKNNDLLMAKFAINCE